MIDFRDSLGSLPVTGLILASVFGKFAGIAVSCWAAVKLGLAKLPEEAQWWQVLGAAWLSGIGLTVSVFIGRIVLDDPVMEEQAKLAILVASLLSSAIGMMWINMGGARGADFSHLRNQTPLPRPQPQPQPHPRR